MNRIYPPVIWTATNSSISLKNPAWSLDALCVDLHCFNCVFYSWYINKPSGIFVLDTRKPIWVPLSLAIREQKLHEVTLQISLLKENLLRCLLLCISFFCLIVHWNSVLCSSGGINSYKIKIKSKELVQGEELGWSLAWGSPSLCN